MLFFSDRLKLEKVYYQWLSKNAEIKNCPMVVISFLVVNGLINEDKAMKYINDNNIKI